MLAYTMPQQRKKEESERLRGERDQIKFIVVIDGVVLALLAPPRDCHFNHGGSNTKIRTAGVTEPFQVNHSIRYTSFRHSVLLLLYTLPKSLSSCPAPFLEHTLVSI